MEAGADRVFHIDAVAFADPQHQPADLGEVGQESVDQLRIVGLQPAAVAAERRVHRGRHRQHVGGHIDRQSGLADDFEQLREFFPVNRDPPGDILFVKHMRREMGKIVEGHRVVARRGDFSGEFTHVRADPRPLQIALLAGDRKVLEGDLRPIDPPPLVSAEERPDRIDEKDLQRHDSCNIGVT